MKDSSLKKVMFSGIFYTAISKYSGIVVSIIIAAVLARILTPHDYGVVAIATIFITFFSILSDMGIGPAIIQKKELTERDLSSIFSFSVYLGVALGLIFFILSSVVAFFYKEESLLTVCRLLSINVAFSTFNVVLNGLMLKDKKFKYLAFRTLVLQILLGGVSIIYAYLGGGIYSLLVAPIGTSILLFFLNYRVYPLKFSFIIDIMSLKKIASYSFYQFAFSIINYFTRNLDSLLIGRYLGLNTLGFYEKSYRLMLMPVQNITHVITPVLHPVFSDYQNDSSFLRDKYTRILSILSVLGYPLSVFLFFSAKEIILIIFGDQWFEAIPIFRILALTIGFQLQASTMGSIFQALNQTKKLFVLGTFNTIVNVTGMFYGVFIIGSAEGVALMMLITFSFLSINWWFVYKWLFQTSGFYFLKRILPSLIASCFLFSLLYFLNQINLFNEFDIISPLIVNVLCTIIVVLATFVYTGEINKKKFYFLKNKLTKGKNQNH